MTSAYYHTIIQSCLLGQQIRRLSAWFCQQLEAHVAMEMTIVLPVVGKALKPLSADLIFQLVCHEYQYADIHDIRSCLQLSMALYYYDIYICHNNIKP